MKTLLCSGLVRLMSEQELAEIAAIDARAYPQPWSEQIFRDCLKAKYHCFVFENEDGLLGYGVLSVVMDEAHILNLCILPEKQGQGLGRELINYMIGLSREKKVETVFLEVRISNEIARHLYDRVGFNEVGIRKNYYPAKSGREDAMVLAMYLS
ncbi:Ribosomal-protein-S18p-alanine acetyltransferase [hydrothermal vent metagenome]|uniref:Ribosomal-protein-S18p-alanine acetyltransferase n=1 Tax=hydrothermal vent metagenome TaxID=652676 RepID=A0A3B0ZGG2_9ZZZZ